MLGRWQPLWSLGFSLPVCPSPQGGGSSLSNDANLSSLAVVWVGLGPLTFGFVPGTTNYNLDIPNSLDKVSVTPVASSSAAKIKANGTNVNSGQAIVITFNMGLNLITVEVTAEDGVTVKNYVVNVTRAAPDQTNAKLAWLLVSQGNLNPLFNENTLSYSVSVGLSVNTITVTPFVSDASATVKVNGSTATHATPFGPISLNTGNNNISILVTAANLTDTKTYTVTVNKAASTNANLSNLVPSRGSLSPAFNSATTSYTASVANAVSSITFTPTAEDSGATIKVNGTPVTSGQQSGSINLNVGTNTVNVVVTAEDSTTTKTYAVTVTRAAPSSNANLSNLVPSVGALSPAFNSAITGYTVSVTNAVSSITFTPTAADAAATITVNGTPVNSGQQSGSISLNVGTNTVNVVVTAEDSTTTKTYTVTVNRAAKPSISGTISESGMGAIGPTSPLIVWWRKANSSVHGMSVYITGSFPRTFSLPDMENGNYYVGAFLDKDNNGDSSPGDLSGQCSNTLVVNGANITNLQITIGSRGEGEMLVGLGNIPEEYYLYLWSIYLVVLTPEADLLVDPWAGYGYQMIMGSNSSAIAFDISSNSKTFAGGSYVLYLFVDYFPNQPSLEDLRNNPPQGLLCGERLVMVDGAAQVTFDFSDLLEFQP